jgi:hypothetical protein
MAYADQKFYSREVVPQAFAVSFGTATGAGTASNTFTAVAALKKTFRRTQINKIRMRCTTIPNASATAVIAQFKNGTNVFGTVVLTTLASLGFADGVITSSANAILAADTQPTVDITGTFTASASAIGAYDIDFEEQEQHS